MQSALGETLEFGIIIISIALILVVFNIRSQLAKQTALNIAIVRILIKIAKNTGTDKEEITKFLDELNQKL